MNVTTLDTERLLGAITRLLEGKGLITEDDIAERIASTDKGSAETGARMIARAWTDPEFRTLMLRDGTAAAEAMGVGMGGLPPLGVLENTPELHHLVVCTLCSCYPRAVLGYPPFWFKSAAYRARAVRDPRGVMQDFGTTIPDEVQVTVIDSTADYRWMVLPVRPEGTETWSEDRLASIVRAGDMIGVTVPSV